MEGEPQGHPYPKDWKAHIIRIIEAVTDPDQVTNKAYVDALFALVSGALVYKGTWDASTNTPTLLNTDTGKTGHFYACTVAGTVDFGAGNITFTTGDRAINNGTIWQKWDVEDQVTSVFSRVGDIAAAVGDYVASQVNNDSDVTGATVKLALQALLMLDGSKAMTGDLDVGGNKVTNATSYEGTGASDAGLVAGAGFNTFDKMGDAAGANSHEFQDSTGAVVGKVDSLGDATLNGLTASQIVETNGAKKLISAAKAAAYNKAFGSGAGTVCEGNDARLSDDRTPLAHQLEASGGPHTGLLPSDEIEVGILGTPTYDLLSELINTNLSSGLISGAAITDAGGGAANVTIGTGLIRTSDSETAPLLALNTPAGVSIALVDGQLNFMFVDYNAGTPQIQSTTTRSNINDNSEFCIGSIFRDGTTLHISLNGRQTIKNVPRWIQHRWEEVEGLSRAFGLVISETGTRNIALTAGEMYDGMNESAIAAFDSSGADDFSYWYNDGSWQEVTAQSAIDNLQYNDFGVGLATLLANRYGVHWIYEDTEGHVHLVYGIGDYTLVNAQAAQPPSTLPAALDSRITMLVGKIIIKKSDATFTETLSAFDVTFSPTVAANHNETGGIQGGAANDYYHLTNAEEIALTTGVNADGQHIHEGTAIKSTGEVGGTKFLREDGDNTSSWQTPSDPNAIHDNVVDEIHQITGKTTPVDADEIVMEDSVASWAKKKLSWANIKATLKTYFDSLYASITHASTHSDGGADEVTVENLATAGTLGQLLTSDGDGSVSMQTKTVEQLLLIGGYVVTLAGNNSGFLRLLSSPINVTSTENRGKIQMPKCTVKAINGRCESVASTLTMTVRKNGVNTTVTGTVSATGTFRLTGSPVDFAKGDELSVSYSTSAGGGNVPSYIMLEFDVEVA